MAMPTKPAIKPPSYGEKTARLEQIRKLLGKYGPVCAAAMEGQAHFLDPLRGSGQDDDVISARNLALIDAWKAVRKIIAETANEAIEA